MKIKDIKKKMLEWKDFYGTYLINRCEIEYANTKEELKELLIAHKSFLDMQYIDAMRHIDNFIDNLAL